MRPSFSELLSCPECRGDVATAPSASEVLLEAELDCASCGRRYPVVRGIPRMTPETLADGQAETAAAFGWEWRHFVELHPEYEQQFLDWIAPLAREAFEGRRVLDAGCGIGRHAYFAARYGAAEVVALDLSEAVETAQRNLAGLPNVDVVQGDLLQPPLRRPEEGGGFDIVYSIGVLHHLPDPAQGIRSLAQLVVPGGLLVVWVYGHEGNTVVRALVDPLRRVTSRLSPSTVRAAALPLAVVLHLAVTLVYGPARGTEVGRRLPLSEYLSSLARFSFRQNYSIVFDQLVAPTSHYVRRSELERWLAAAGLVEVEVTERTGNSWRGRGRRPPEGSSPA